MLVTGLNLVAGPPDVDEDEAAALLLAASRKHGKPTATIMGAHALKTLLDLLLDFGSRIGCCVQPQVLSSEAARSPPWILKPF